MTEDGHVLRARPNGTAACDLLAPTVGVFEPSVSEGDAVASGGSVGTIEALGVRQPLIVPQGVAGRVTAMAGEGKTRAPVQYGDVLLTVTTASFATAAENAPRERRDDAGSLAFVAPMSGRFYSRPSPGEEPFVRDGDVVRHGQTVGLLEVMKTFNRLVYQGEGLPREAEVARVVPGDGDDVVQGDVILALAESETS